jgi:hypothetical protein
MEYVLCRCAASCRKARSAVILDHPGEGFICGRADRNEPSLALLTDADQTLVQTAHFWQDNNRKRVLAHLLRYITYLSLLVERVLSFPTPPVQRFT